MKAEENSDTKCTLHELNIILTCHRIIVLQGTTFNKNNVMMAVSA